MRKVIVVKEAAIGRSYLDPYLQFLYSLAATQARDHLEERWLAPGRLRPLTLAVKLAWRLPC